CRGTDRKSYDPNCEALDVAKKMKSRDTTRTYCVLIGYPQMTNCTRGPHRQGLRPWGGRRGSHRSPPLFLESPERWSGSRRRTAEPKIAMHQTGKCQEVHA